MRFIFVLFILCAAPAMAEVSVLRDVDSGITLSVPDSWGLAPNKSPQHAITAIAPDGKALLEITQYPDARFAVYPTKLDGNVQEVAIDRAFWNAYWGKFYNDVVSYKELNRAGIGRAFAGMSEAAFTRSYGELKGQRRIGIVAAGIYNNKLTTAMCSSDEKDWKIQKRTCLRILDSLDNVKVDNEFQPQGYYRDFMADDPTIIRGKRQVDTHLH